MEHAQLQNIPLVTVSSNVSQIRIDRQPRYSTPILLFVLFFRQCIVCIDMEIEYNEGRVRNSSFNKHYEDS